MMLLCSLCIIPSLNGPLANSIQESPLHSMANRKRKAEEDGDGDESMSAGNSPRESQRVLARPTKKVRPTEVTGRSLTLPRLLETLDTHQLRSVLERICERHPDIGHEVVTGAPRPTPSAVLDVLLGYQAKFQESIPYGESSPEYTYYRVKDALIEMVDAIADFTTQFLPPVETQPVKSLQFLDGATKIIHDLPDWEPQGYRYHKENAYEEISKAWALVINEAGKRASGFNLHSGGWDQTLARHNEQSGGRLPAAINAMTSSVGWMASSHDADASEQNSILDQLISGTFGPAVRVGPW